MEGSESKHQFKKPKMMTEFKEFIMKGNILAMAVGIIIGVAFGAVVKSAVDDVLMPPIGLALGGADFKDSFVVLKEGTLEKGTVNETKTSDFDTLDEANAAGAITLRYGLFINTIINFLIIALVLFFIIRAAAKFERKKEEAAPTTKACPFCDTQISLNATKCPNCTSKL